nr:11675_t:CDS:2 [Entrophospora candida]CAG8581353.1 143_t:CDS:2 [Entrophospora candida]
MIFKGLESLENIVQTTSKIASLNFSRNDEYVNTLFSRPEKGKQIVREATPHETKLYQVITSSIEPFKSEELNQISCHDKVTPKTIDNLLGEANSLLIDIPHADDTIKSLAQRYEDITSSIDKKRMERYEIAEQIKMTNPFDIKKEELEILELEKIKNDYIKKIDSVTDEINTHRQLEFEVMKFLDEHHHLSMLNIDINIINEINKILVNNYLSIPNPSQQIVLAAFALKIIHDAGGEISLAELKEKIMNANFQILYVLVAKCLIDIDRSNANNIVRSQLFY